MHNAASSMRLARPLPYSKYFKEFSDADFGDRSYCKKYLERHIHKHSLRSQRGLFDGKENKSGNTYCYSDKRHKRQYIVNAQLKKFTSDILGCELEILMTMHAARIVTKYGGIDNYILLRKEGDMQSIYGEYLREMMLRKLNDPSFQVTEVLRNPIYKVKLKKKGKRLLKYQKKYEKFQWSPPEFKTTDMSHLHEVEEADIPLRDRRKVGSCLRSTKRSNIR